MATHPYPLIAYDAAGNIVATLDYMRHVNADGTIGLVDFAAHEEAGGEHLDIWNLAAQLEGAVVPFAKGSKVWPEWIDRPLDFRVELAGAPGAKRIVALVHKASGHRRVRADIEAAIAERIAGKKAEAKARGDVSRAATKAREVAAKVPRKERVAHLVPDPPAEPTDIRDLVGGPDRPLQLDDQGRSLPWVSLEEAAAAGPALPVLGAVPPAEPPLGATAGGPEALAVPSAP